MAEPENTQRPPEPATISPEASRPFDVPAHDRTASYPDRPTITFAGTPDNGDAPTRTNLGHEQDYEIASGEPCDPGLPDVPGYRLIRVLGQGGMGTVYKALHLALKRVVALKLSHCSPNSHTRPHHDVEFRTRFEREKTILAKLDHPNVVPIYDAGFWQGVPYLTMKFVTGKTLAHHLGELRNNLRDAATLLAKVAHAIDYLHKQGIIHRDIKPLNILVSLEGTPYVADLGLVREMADDSEFSISIIPLGTKQYMSPEQTRGGRENYTPACDIWAFGITLYELLAGERPFADSDHFELLRKIRQEPVPAIPAERGIPASLEAIVRKCLQKPIADRYATAGEIASDLERWLAGEEIAMPESPPITTPVALLAQPAPKPKRRVRWALAGVALVTLLGFSGVLPAPIPQPRELTLTEKLDKGETVWLIGEKGKPLVDAQILFGGSSLAVDHEGYCCLNSITIQFAEFFNVPANKTVKLEGNIAIRAGKPGIGHGGFYVGRQQMAFETSQLHTAWKVGIISGDQTRNEKTVTTTERGLLETASVREDFRSHATLPIDSSLVFNTEQANLPTGLPPRWHPFTITIGPPNTLSASCHGKPFAVPLDLKKKMRSHAITAGLQNDAFAEPLGPGIGVFAIDAEVLFQNVRLSLSPPKP